MSGNSSLSIPQTVPIVSKRCFGEAVAAISAVQERHSVLADLYLVAVLELRRLDALPVDEGAVQAPLVLDEEAAVARDEHGVLARDGDVVEEDAAVGGAADRGGVGFGVERLPRPSAARADDQGRPADAEVVERVGGLERGLLGREGLRGLDAAVVLGQQRAAAGAVIGGFLVLEAALLAVDVAHSVAGGAAFAARMAVRWSTSTWSSTLRPSVFCSRATSSARRMSIFPCRSRRWYEISFSSRVRSSISFLRSSSVRLARSGRGSTGPPFWVEVALIEAAGLTRVNLRLRLVPRPPWP